MDGNNNILDCLLYWQHRQEGRRGAICRLMPTLKYYYQALVQVQVQAPVASYPQVE